MPSGYGTYGPWGTSGTTSPAGSYSAPGGNVREEGSNRVADAVNIARAAPPQISASLDLQNKAKLAIAQENIHRGIGKYAGQFPEATELYEAHDWPGKELGASFNQATPDMLFGPGSVFGATTGSTASSQPVQDVLNFMIDDKIKQAEEKKGQQLSSHEVNKAINNAMDTYYPGWLDWKSGEGDIPANLMDIDEGLPLPGHQTIADLRRPSFDQSWSGMGDFDHDFYDGMPPEIASLSDPKWWQQTALSDIDPTGFADLQRIYGKEFGEERMAAPHAWGIEPFSETIIEGTY
tara:strand:- start:587 stop:1462 length:876 start_codon:yes stop_codon:yes gene_type:complete